MEILSTSGTNPICGEFVFGSILRVSFYLPVSKRTRFVP
jgi:hypothetical protein